MHLRWVRITQNPSILYGHFLHDLNDEELLRLLRATGIVPQQERDVLDASGYGAEEGTVDVRANDDELTNLIGHD